MESMLSTWITRALCVAILCLAACTGSDSENGSNNGGEPGVDAGDVADAADGGAPMMDADGPGDMRPPQDQGPTTDGDAPDGDLGGETGTDAGGGGNVCDLQVCLSDADCDDGNFCNGQEECVRIRVGTEDDGCRPGEPPCGDRLCSEAQDRCGCDDNSQCNDGRYCNGEETCAPINPAADENGCLAGEPVECNASLASYCSDTEMRCCTVLTPCDCERDSQCDDGQWCNGVERCDPSNPDANEFGCVGPSVNNICLFVPCDESRDCCEDTDGSCIQTGDPDRCETSAADGDGDGVEASVCGGADCDDDDYNRHPGNAEVCDAIGHDEDCDTQTLGNEDADGDGFISDQCCNEQPDGTLDCGRDCDDGDGAVNPNEAERCNGIDDDCNGLIDDGVDMVLYRDADGDGFGQPGCSVVGCSTEPGFSTKAGDCDDSNPAIGPGDAACVDQTTIRTCQSDGTWKEEPCPSGTTCKSQPNGTGVCS